MKKIVSGMLAALTLLTCTVFTSCGETSSDMYTVGIIEQRPHAALDSASKGFRDALEAELGKDRVEFIEQNGQGDVTTCTTIVNDFVTKNVDLILANATTALQAAVNGTATIPILGTSVTEYGVVLGIDNFDGLIGSNVSGTSDLAPLDKQADIILELFPDTAKTALLYCSAEPNSAYQIKKISEYLTDKGIVCEEFPFTDSNDIVSVATVASKAADVIYIPTDNTAASCAEAIFGAIGNTPVIGGDTGICNGCGVATVAISYYDLGYTTGKMAARILRGEEKIEEMRIAYAENYSKVYNPVICKELGLDAAELEAKGYTPLEIN